MGPVEQQSPRCVHTHAEVIVQLWESSLTTGKELQCHRSAFKKPDVSYQQETPNLQLHKGRVGNVWPTASSGARAGVWAELKPRLRPQGLATAGQTAGPQNVAPPQSKGGLAVASEAQGAGCWVTGPLGVLLRWTELPGNHLGVTPPRVTQALGA